MQGRIPKIAVWFLLTFLAVRPAVWADELTITVADQATVSGPVITLGDIATINGDDSGRIDYLSRISLGAAPAPGSSVTLTDKLLSARLAASRADLSGIVWQRPPAVVITAAAQTVNGQVIADQALADLRNRLGTPLPGDEVSVRLLEKPHDVAVTPGRLSLLTDLPSGIKLQGATLAKVTLKVDGNRNAVVPVRFEVRLFRPVLVAARAIAAGEIIDAGGVRKEKVDVGQPVVRGYVTDLDRIAGFAARYALAPGTVLTNSALAAPVIIKRGGEVVIMARTGGIEVKVPGIALENGGLGQTIKVQNVSSRKVVTTRVLNSTTVEIINF